MAVVDEVNGESNGHGEVEFDEGEEKETAPLLIQIEPSDDGNKNRKEMKKKKKEEETLYIVFHRLFTEIFYPDHKTSESTTTTSLLQRIKSSFYENGSSLQKASRNSTDNLIAWTRQGSPLRAILVISVGANALVALTGLLVFTLFFLAATINAVIISLLMSLAAAGGFLAVFFAFTTAIYIGALSVAIFVISTLTITTIISIMITTGWVAFFWGVWWTAKKSISIAECSLNMTGSAISAYSASRKVHHHAPDKDE